jgi:hypothetical protein
MRVLPRDLALHVLAGDAARVTQRAPDSTQIATRSNQSYRTKPTFVSRKSCGSGV